MSQSVQRRRPKRFPPPIKTIPVARQKVKVSMNKFWYINPFELASKQKQLRKEAKVLAEKRVNELTDDGFLTEIVDEYDDFIVVYRSNKRITELVKEIEAKRKKRGKKVGNKYRFTLAELKEEERIVKNKYYALLKKFKAIPSTSR